MSINVKNKLARKGIGSYVLYGSVDGVDRAVGTYTGYDRQEKGYISVFKRGQTFNDFKGETTLEKAHELIVEHLRAAGETVIIEGENGP